MSKEKPRYTIYVSIDGCPPVIAGKAGSLQSGIAHCEKAIETGKEVYARGYGDNPARDVWTVYDDKNAVTRWTSKRR